MRNIFLAKLTISCHNIDIPRSVIAVNLPVVYETNQLKAFVLVLEAKFRLDCIITKSCDQVVFFVCCMVCKTHWSMTGRSMFLIWFYFLRVCLTLVQGTHFSAIKEVVINIADSFFFNFCCLLHSYISTHSIRF